MRWYVQGPRQRRYSDRIATVQRGYSDGIRMTTRSWIAALPMYNVTPALRDHWRSLVSDALAFLVESGFTDPVVQPEAISSDLEALWTRDDLLLSQTCGYPLMRVLPASIGIVATPVFDVPGCDGPRYSSVFVVSEAAYSRGATTISQCRGLKAAFNDANSNSGMNVFRHAVAPYAHEGRFFGSVVETGSHLASLRALAFGEADVAAIDCVTFAFAEDIPEIARERVHILGFSEQTPGLPLICSSAVSDGVIRQMRAALSRALDSDPERARVLRLRSFAHLTRDDYAAIVALENEAILAGYPRLA